MTPDGLGSITSPTNPAGQIAQMFTFNTFGKQMASSGSLTNPFQYTGREFDAETSLYYYRARYYDPTSARFLSEDPIGFVGGIDFYTYVHSDPIDFSDPFGLRDYDEQQTVQLFLQPAYADATAGRIQGLRNIYNNSRGKYDFGWNEHDHDTFVRCGRKMTADQFGNYIAGFEGAAYDHYYFWTTGTVWAQAAVEIYGIKYHMTGATKAKNDPWDKTGRPDIRRGERDGWSFRQNKAGCGCGGGGGF